MQAIKIEPRASGTLRDALGRALGGLEEFASVWEGVLSDPHGPFSADQVEALAQIDEAGGEARQKARAEAWGKAQKYNAPK